MEEEEVALQVVREQPPANYALRIESLSSLLDSLVDRRLSSTEFSTGGHNWVLIVDLNEKKDDTDDGYISMYLKLIDKLKPNEAVNAMFRFFVYNQKMDNYLVKQDMTGKHFSLLKTEWGISEVLPLSTFNDAANGYVINDCCVFGTEVFVLKNDFWMGTLSPVSEANVNHHYSWTVSQYSKLNDEYCNSPVFTFDGISWKLEMCPQGDARVKGKNISIFLSFGDDSKLTIGGGKIFVEFEIILKDQLGSNDIKRSGRRWFQANGGAWGYPAFLSLSDLKDPTKGYLLKDELIIEADVKTIFRLQNA
ncbi:hypothetical protein Dimus_009856 [Dionaea muscipula]